MEKANQTNKQINWRKEKDKSIGQGNKCEVHCQKGNEKGKSNMLSFIFTPGLQVVRRPSATAEPSDMMVMKLSLVMEEVR